MEKISFQHRLEYFGYSLIEKFATSIPDHALVGVARFFAFLGFHVLRIRRKVAIRNISLVFPNKSFEWCRTTAYFSFLHFSMMILEFMKMSKWSGNRIKEKVATSNATEFQHSVQKGKGAILVSGHFGNWEIAMGYLFLLGSQFVVIQQRQKNRLVNNRMKTLREKWGMEIILPRGAVEQSVIALKNKKVVGLLGDQDAGKRGIMVPFLGQMSATHVGAAALYLKTGVPLFVGTCVRVKTQRFDIDIRTVPLKKSGEKTKPTLEEVTISMVKELEKSIRKYPQQYFWMHRRWKSTGKY
jgi:KDO2-lipid IV(A) lauroyltransferase